MDENAQSEAPDEGGIGPTAAHDPSGAVICDPTKPICIKVTVGGDPQPIVPETGLPEPHAYTISAFWVDSTARTSPIEDYNQYFSNLHKTLSVDHGVTSFTIDISVKREQYGNLVSKRIEIVIQGRDNAVAIGFTVPAPDPA